MAYVNGNRSDKRADNLAWIRKDDEEADASALAYEIGGRWLPVYDYERLYLVSDQGEHWSIKTKTLMSQAAHSQGYCSAVLTRTGKQASCVMHRLVALAHIGQPPQPRMDVNHKNGIKTDNRLENLEWSTRADNLRHAREVLGRQMGLSKGKLAGVRNPNCKLSESDVVQIRKMAREGITLAAMAKLFPVAAETIGRVVAGKTWAHVPTSE